jgi:DNA-binding GntR family transcriptional regulator
MALANTSTPTLETPIPADASLAARAYYELRDRIVSLRIPPGGLIREDEMIQELGMSRTPLREALQRLAQEQLVSVIPRRGTFVTEVHVGDVGTIYEFRRELEPVAARWAAERRTKADLPELSKLIDELSELAAAPGRSIDARAQIVGDQQAHHLVYRLSGNPLLEDMLSVHYFQATRIWFLAATRVTMEDPYMIDVLKAVRKGDTDAAAKHARAHNEAAESAIRAVL